MARSSSKKRRKRSRPTLRQRVRAFISSALRVLGWSLGGLVLLLILWIGAYRFVNPPTGWYMFTESQRLGGVRQEWVTLDQMASAMPLSVVAAEDVNFCRHWGFDMQAIRAALADGGARGASTLTQQVVKNVFLWHGRNFLRKGLEALITPLVEILWPKDRILEVYLNMAEFDEGIFGVQAAAQRYFRVDAAALSPRQSALMASVLPDPQGRDAHQPTSFMLRRADAIQDGAATIARDDRSACFGG